MKGPDSDALLEAVPTSVGKRRETWEPKRPQGTDAERAQQACANSLAFIHQAKQQMRRAYALFSLALHLFCCQEDHLFGAGCEQLERIGRDVRKWWRALARLALMRLAVEDKHNTSMNPLRRNPQWREKRRETLLARQTPQQVFGADPPVFQVEHLLAGQIEHPATLRCHECGEGVEWRFLFLHTIPVPF